MNESRTDSKIELVDRYFDCIGRGDPSVADLLAPDIIWLAPASAPVGRRHEGRDAVLALMGTGIDLYDPETPLAIEREAIASSGDRVFVEMTITAKTAAGEDYLNQYVFVFTIREGLIVEIHEHLDSLYAQRKLFDPVGQASPLDKETI